MNNAKIGVVLAVSILMALLAAGCNTLKGVGQDIEKGGEAIQRAATKK